MTEPRHHFWRQWRPRLLAAAAALALVLRSVCPAPAAVTNAAAEGLPLLRIGLIADCQYADADARGIRLYRESRKKLEEAVAHFEVLKPNLVFHLGDLTDRDGKNLEVILPIFNRLPMPHLIVLGNHDFQVKTELKADVIARFGLDRLGGGRGYYDLALRGCRLVVLNSLAESVVAYAPGTPERQAAERILADLARRKAPNAVNYNGGLGPRQRAWLDLVLARADRAGERALVFSHIPAYPPDNHQLWDWQEALAILEAHPSVAAFIAGHRHEGAYIERAGIHHLTLCGMIETPQTAYAMLDVCPDRLVVTGFGRQPSYVLPLAAAPPWAASPGGR
jgi:manganese-dependent ADP-ribose/CDP-alcohol diphosphatase